MSQIKKNDVLGLLLGCVIAIMLVVSLSDQLDLPIVAKDQHGECVWIMRAPFVEKIDCPIILPETYETVKVRSK